MARTTGYAMDNSKLVGAARKLRGKGKNRQSYATVAKALHLSSAKAAWCLVNNKAA